MVSLLIGRLRPVFILLPLALLPGWVAAQAPEIAAVTFDILEFEVQGNTVLPAQTIEEAITPFLGPTKQMSNVEAARTALEKAYQDRGYLTVFVDVPQQRVNEGVIVLSVTEGRVARLSVTGSRYFSQGYIREKVPELADGKVPNFNEVQRQLALVNRTEDRRVQPVMRAGKVPGTVETELKVEDRLPLNGSVEINNRHAADTKALRLSATARYENLFQLDHSVAFTLATAPQATSESRVVSLTYTIPTAEQSAWVGYFVNSNSSVAAIGDVNVLGKGTTLGLRYVRPLSNTADESHSLTFGVDYKDIGEDVRTGSGVISTPLRYLPFQVAYSGTFDHAPQTQTLLNLQVAAASRDILRRTNPDCPGGEVDQFACKRQGGDGSFATLKGDIRHAMPLGASGAAGTLHLRLGGQLASGPVPSAEQFTIGGAESIRGYLEAEGAGDRAVLGSVEWRSRDFSSSVSGWVQGPDATSRLFTQSYALAFADVGRAYTEEPAAGQAARISLAGVGFGLRLKLRKATTGELDLAWPLKATTASPSRSARLHFKLSFEL